MIARKKEQKILHKILSDSGSQLVMVAGRYRVGKTVFVQESCKNRIAFELCGTRDATLTQHLVQFHLELKRFFPEGSNEKMPRSWEEAFTQLTAALQQVEEDSKKVIFLDEVCWLDGKRAQFQDALAGWWSEITATQDLVLILCGSDVAGMQKMQHSALLGPFVDESIQLLPFTLLESREFLESRRILLTNYQLVLLYMALGGIPYYLAQIQPEKSAGENIQAICFDKKGPLRDELARMEALLFDKKGISRKIFEALIGKVHGLTRAEILLEIKLLDGGWFTELLSDLEESGFLRSIPPLDKRKKATVYRFGDPFLCFYMHFILSSHANAGVQWNPMQQAELYKGWSTYALENVCSAHILQIRQHMGISGLEARLVSLTDPRSDVNFDVLLERKDGILNVIKVYLSADIHTISESEHRQLMAQNARLVSSLKGKKEVQWWSMSVYGIREATPFFAHQLNIESLLDVLK